MAFKILEDKENPLLNRRELVCLFPGSAGKLTRDQAIKAVAQKLGLPEEKTILINIQGSHGTTDVKAILYVYNNLEDAKRQLPKHVMLRLLPKEERKKIMEQKRKTEAKK